MASRSTPANLAEVVERVAADPALPLRRRQDIASACRRVAALLTIPLAEIAADPVALRERLKRLPAVPNGMTPARWRNVRSLVRAALTHTGAATTGKRSRQALSPAWQQCLASVPERYWRAKLSRVARYCTLQQIAPEQVTDPVVDAFGLMLRQSMVERPKQVHRDTCLAWNRAVGELPGWPARTLAVPRNRRDFAIDLPEFPASFGADVAAFLLHLGGDDPFGETARRIAGPVTLHHRRIQLRQLASALVLSGRDIATITRLADLVAPEAAKKILSFFWARNGQRKTGQLYNFTLLLVQLAKHWVKARPEQVTALQHFRRQIELGKTGFTARNRARLRAFDDPENVRRLLAAPAAMVRALDRTRKPTFSDAIVVQSALGIALALVAPIRAKNLAALHVARHFPRTRPGLAGVTHLVIPADAVKNNTDLEFELPPDVVQLLNRYINDYRPLLATDASGYLFPARKGGAKTPAQLAEQLRRAIHHHTGLDFNLHLFRHLAAKLFLEAHPGEYETVRLLLGHRNLVTTVRAYCDLRSADAARRYDAVLRGYFQDAAD